MRNHDIETLFEPRPRIPCRTAVGQDQVVLRLKCLMSRANAESRRQCAITVHLRRSCLEARISRATYAVRQWSCSTRARMPFRCEQCMGDTSFSCLERMSCRLLVSGQRKCGDSGGGRSEGERGEASQQYERDRKGGASRRVLHGLPCMLRSSMTRLESLRRYRLKTEGSTRFE